MSLKAMKVVQSVIVQWDYLKLLLKMYIHARSHFLLPYSFFNFHYSSSSFSFVRKKYTYAKIYLWPHSPQGEKGKMMNIYLTRPL